jgi:hypothetical protein
MIDRSEQEGRHDEIDQKTGSSWTKLHSWVFLSIIALGFLVLGMQNRYHYLSPAGLGKAYRIDKIFGGIQEFEPTRGWIVAQLLPVAPPHAMSMLEPSSAGPQVPQVNPMNVPASAPVPVAMDREPEIAPIGAAILKEQKSSSSILKENLPSSSASVPQTVTAVKPLEEKLSKEQRFQLFHNTFPDFGEDEFQLASDDLFPDWKKRIAPNGTWADFLVTYKDFIRWWNDAGNPAESGVKLWQEYLAARGRS